MSGAPADPATPEQLAEWPELAALEVAASAADTAARAIMATFPSLQVPDFLLDHDDVTPQLCLAAAALTALGAVETAVERYRVHLDQLAAARHRATASNPF
jgi:hypothetical protein